jgi:Gas vesicle protein
MSDRGALSRDDARELFTTSDSSLLDVIDNLLTKGVVVSGDVVLGIAGIDLIYARLSVLLCAADRLLERRDDATGVPRP